MDSSAQIHSVRQQLLLDEQVALFDYWASKQEAGHVAPRRASIDPVEIPKLLPSLSLIATGEGVFDARYRLAGTRLRDLFGGEATGRFLIDLVGSARFGYWEAVYDQVVNQASPACGASPFTVNKSAPAMHFWLRLPLVDETGKVALMLGHDWLLEKGKAEAKARRAGVSLADAFGT